MYICTVQSYFSSLIFNQSSSSNSIFKFETILWKVSTNSTTFSFTTSKFVFASSGLSLHTTVHSCSISAKHNTHGLYSKILISSTTITDDLQSCARKCLDTVSMAMTPSPNVKLTVLGCCLLRRLVRLILGRTIYWRRSEGDRRGGASSFFTLFSSSGCNTWTKLILFAFICLHSELVHSTLKCFTVTGCNLNNFSYFLWKHRLQQNPYKLKKNQCPTYDPIRACDVSEVWATLNRYSEIPSFVTVSSYKYKILHILCKWDIKICYLYLILTPSTWTFFNFL